MYSVSNVHNRDTKSQRGQKVNMAMLVFLFKQTVMTAVAAARIYTTCSTTIACIPLLLLIVESWRLFRLMIDRRRDYVEEVLQNEKYRS